MSDAPSELHPAAPPVRPAPGFRLALGALVLLLVGAVAGGVLWGRPRPEPDARRGFDVLRPAASPAADFSLRDLDGREVALRDFRGRLVLVNFWATWCPPCREEIPAMQTLARDLGPQGLVVLAVNFEEEPEAVRAFARDTGMRLPVLLDRDGGVGRQYRVTGLPTSVFVDRRGALAGTVLGFRDWAGPGAQAYLRELLTRPD
jgi:thiol-disulfide isomerase/thioredoxin